ncbi:MAG TPA: peptidoglycan editing factor PgeF [Noviherbaspirillum sp.]|uniref:peptidoglycan editing factor PgeF n=1 Tax=Noviherbaspirillum sp. TaxID=1926288 RepID=UPI002D40C396|nr:peptidoglycan editing factor PgeF [Noviherbaspirillum sp.]HYD95507.1 peptidoglycan editing factor PgeF [Noviherbaspirillum sp.]
MELILPDWTGAPPNIGAFCTTRSGGCSTGPYDDGAGGGGLNLGVHVGDDADAVARNRALLRGLLPQEPAWLSQVHGSTVADAGTVSGAPRADACIATTSGAVCVIQTADCLPVLFCDAGGAVVGAAHAGWRGLAGGVLENTVRRMRDTGASRILAWLGPAIGPQCFEVGQDVFDAFVACDRAAATAFVPQSGHAGKYLADIYALARLALQRAGVEQVSGGGLCTVTDERRFYSYRRDRVTGRMASLIWLK